MQKVAFSNLAAIKKKEECRIAQLDKKRHDEDVKKDRIVEAEIRKEADEKRAAMIQIREYNTRLCEEKKQRMLEKKQKTPVCVVDKPLEAEKKLQEEIVKKKQDDHERAPIKRRDEKQRQAQDERKLKESTIMPENVKKRQELQKIAIDHLTAIKEEEECHAFQLEQRRLARDLEKVKAQEAEKKRQGDEKKATMMRNKIYNCKLREEKSQKKLQEKKMECDWYMEKHETKEEEKKGIQRIVNKKQVLKDREVKQEYAIVHLRAIREKEEDDVSQLKQKRRVKDVEKKKAVEAKMAKEVEEKRLEMVEARDYNIHLAEEKRKQMLQDKYKRPVRAEDKRGEEKKATQEQNWSHRNIVAENVVKRRQEMQKITFDRLVTIKKEEKGQIAQLEKKTHAQHVEKERAAAIERRKGEDKKMIELVKTRDYNCKLKEEKIQRDLQEKKTRCDWLVDKRKGFRRS